MQGSHLEQLVQYDIGVGVTLHVYDDTHTLTACLVVYIRDALKLSFLHQLRNVLYQLLLVDAIRYLRNDNLVMSLLALNLSLGSHDYTATSCLVCLPDTLQTIYVCARREVRSRNVLHQPLGINLRIVYERAASVYHLREVVGWHIGSHTHGDTITAINQQVRYLCRHHGRLEQRVVEVVRHVDGILLKVIHYLLAHLGEPTLRIPHGSRRVSVNATEVTLSVDKLITHIPLLSHAHECAIDRRVTMWMVLTKHLSDDARTLLVRLVAGVSYTEHTI